MCVQVFNLKELLSLDGHALYCVSLLYSFLHMSCHSFIFVPSDESKAKMIVIMIIKIVSEGIHK